jgi:hypothetical protein
MIMKTQKISTQLVVLMIALGAILVGCNSGTPPPPPEAAMNDAKGERGAPKDEGR